MTDLGTVRYEDRQGQVSWRGASIEGGEEFDRFITNDVASRLDDEEGRSEFEAHLRGLASTGFARESLKAVLEAQVPERRGWAVCEAFAEAYLGDEYEISWPWNMERDKRNPNASLAGADLIGFRSDGSGSRLALGEVKSSTDANSPPGVMDGRSGMAHQIDRLAADLSLICQILMWLLPRCKGTAREASFNEAVGLFLGSGNRAISLFGVLIRDTQPNEMDLRARGRTLGGTLQEPATCDLIAIYLPCAIADLASRVSGGAS